MIQLFFSHTGELKHDYKASEKDKKVLDWYLSEGLIIIHVQHLAKQQTPFSKEKSPESPKHRKEKVEGDGGWG